MKKILTIGSVMHDIFIEAAHPDFIELHTNNHAEIFIALKEGRKIEVEKIIHASGGGASNTAVSFTLLGFETFIWACVGEDAAGNFVTTYLEKKSVKTSLIKRSNTSTGTSFIIPAASGNRAILVYRGANLELHTLPLPPELTTFDYLYITSLTGPTSKLLPALVKEAHAAHIPVATNPGTSQLKANVETLKEALPFIKILILNSYEAHLLMNTLTATSTLFPSYSFHTHTTPHLLQKESLQATNTFSLINFFQEILNRGPHMVVVTNGADGVYVTDGQKIFHHQSNPSYITSTVGAGDAFASTFVAYLIKGNTVETAIRAGIANTSSVLGSLGAQEGLLSSEKLEQKMQFISPLLLQSFSL